MAMPQGHTNCQIPCLRSIAEGNAPVPRQSPMRVLKLVVRRRLSPRQEQALKGCSFMPKMAQYCGTS